MHLAAYEGAKAKPLQHRGARQRGASDVTIDDNTVGEAGVAGRAFPECVGRHLYHDVRRSVHRANYQPHTRVVERRHLRVKGSADPAHLALADALDAPDGDPQRS
jgi:hypothetical protein